MADADSFRLSFSRQQLEIPFDRLRIVEAILFHPCRILHRVPFPLHFVLIHAITVTMSGDILNLIGVLYILLSVGIVVGE